MSSASPTRRIASPDVSTRLDVSGQHRTHRIRTHDGAQLRVAAHGRDVAIGHRAARFQQHHACRQAQHFVELVAHVDDGNGERVAQSFEVGQHLLASREVERSQRFVEQQQPRLREQRATERHALFLAAGQLMRAALR